MLAYCILIVGHICSESHQSRYLLDKHNQGVVQWCGNISLDYYKLADTLDEVPVVSTPVLQLSKFLKL